MAETGLDVLGSPQSTLESPWLVFLKAPSAAGLFRAFRVRIVGFEEGSARPRLASIFGLQLDSAT
jgi:hypothetical protein